MNLRLTKYRKVLGGGLLALLGGSSTAFADQADIHFAGFASLAYAKTITDDKHEGQLYGMSNEGEYRDYNKLGFRMDADMKDNLTFTAQVIALGADNYDPAFDWIFATYAITSELAVSVGKVRVPVFMYSDSLDVGYSYQWIQPPVVVYNNSQTPFKSIEGVKFSYVTDMGGWTSELLAWGGSGEDPFKESGLDTTLKLEEALGLAWTVERDWLSLRAFYFQADATMDVTTNAMLGDLMYGSGAVFDGTSSVLLDPGNLSVSNIEATISAATGGAVRPNFHDALLWDKDPGQFYGLGAAFDFERFFITSEITRIDVNGKDSNIVAPRLDSFYITGGVRLPAQVTVSLTYGEDRDYASKKTWTQFDPYIGMLGGALDPLLVPYRAGMQALVNSLQDYNSKSAALGVRWDFHPAAAFKFEYLVEDRSGANARANNMHQPQAVRVGLDLVF